jgi:chemotaxis protein methyltransferase CheR
MNHTGHQENLTSKLTNNETLDKEILSSPVLLFLYYRIEQIFGIKARSESLISLNDYIENNCRSSFVENPASYEHILTSREHIFEISNFITVNETYFFREGIHFLTLLTLLPQIIIKDRPIQICSAASSIGCEAYSIAMLLDNYSNNIKKINFTIDAFDVNAQALKTAKNARYSLNTIRSESADWKHIIDSYLIPDENSFLVKDEIRDKVNFFTHNIMRGLDRRYDIIFFRNALIYFSSRNRQIAVNNLIESLFDDGFLFLGISETASVDHSLLTGRNSNDVFYFQKNSGAVKQPLQPSVQKIPGIHITKTHRFEKIKNENINGIKSSSSEIKRNEMPVDCNKVTAALEIEDGQQNAQNVLDIILGKKEGIMSGSELAACALYFLNIQDFNSADTALSHLEKFNSGSMTRFLRGEYYLLNGSVKDAENYFEEAAVKDRFFWPAFYRIASLAADGNRTRYEYRIKKTLESINLSQSQENSKERKYECFLGGFSPDYFRLMLEKKLA